MAMNGGPKSEPTADQSELAISSPFPEDSFL